MVLLLVIPVGALTQSLTLSKVRSVPLEPVVVTPMG